MNVRFFTKILAGALMLALSAGAEAAPGDHIRAGDLVIIPRLDFGMEHRTNVYRSASEPTSGTNLRVSPQLELAAEGREAAFSLSGAYELRKYLQEQLTNLDRYSDFNVDASLDLLRERTLGLEIRNTTGLRNREVERPFAAAPFHTQFRNQLDGTTLLRAGPVLEFRAGGFWIYDDYFVPDIQEEGTRPFNFRHAVGPKASAQWLFFPRTALVAEGEVAFNRWNNNWVPTANPDSPLGTHLALPDSTLWRAQFGVRGRVTERLVLVMMGGYGQASYDEESVVADGADPEEVGTIDADVRGLDGLLLSTQLTFALGADPQDRVILGYRRNFEDSWFSNYLTYDEVYSTLDTRLGGRFGIHLTGRARFETYAGEVDRQDFLLRGEAGVSYGLQDWARISTGVWYTRRTSESIFPEVEYDDVNFHMMATVLY